MSSTSMIIPCYFLDESYIDMTDECLGSLTEEPDQIIIVDDGSPMHAEFANTECIRLDENSGFTKAVNTGLKHATGDILIVCNNDIVFIQHEWLQHLICPLLDGYGISSIRTTDSDGWLTEDKITEGDKFGSIFAITRDTYEELGGLDEQFKGYYSDLDYRRRAINAGIKIAKNHAGLVDHQGKATYSKTDKEDDDFVKMTQAYKTKWGMIE